MGKMELAAALMYRTSILNLLRRFRSSDLKILAYHRIKDIGSENDYEFDAELISASVSDFEWQVEHVKKFYNPTTFEEIVSDIENGRRVAKNSVIISFDDGFDDNYINAFPVLKKHGVPATFFIATDYIGTTNPFWFDYVSYIIKKIPEGKYHLDNNNYIIDITKDNKESELCRLLKFLKGIPDDSRIKRIEELKTLYGVDIPSDGYNDCMPLTWNQVVEMSKNGMEIGSHTRSHPVLSQLDKSKLEDEIVNSRNIINDKINNNCVAIAYPVGGKQDFNNEIKAMSESAYKIGCSYIAGSNSIPDDDRFELKRLHVERYTSKALFAAMLAAPNYFRQGADECYD
ncbi:MAG: polysaccharide deacetylase family protein [Gammaproteobacteria bacterium]|nr:polysaccharide deacetylase family protein [Gammaproteobacteria bacterium]